jgi:plasmid stability protein
MKNVTVSLPEDTARWLRVEAAKADRSVSRWLADLLDTMRRQDNEYEAAMARYLAIKPRKFRWVDGRKPTREELHDRASFR